MHVVLRGIIVWTLYALASCVSIVCRSTAERELRWELVFDPTPDELYERFEWFDDQRRQQRRQRTAGRWLQRRSNGNGANPQELQMAAAAATVQQSNVAIAAAASAADDVCDCTLMTDVVELREHHYPNQLPTMRCRDGPWCKKIEYPVQVLTNLTNVYDSPYSQENLPKELSDMDWWFVQINITVACSCPK
ncbi:uncharacterized protein LOC112688434 isoform X2 [Sipha flava]|uniref:Uncharacterized protein LOC112688434 isoform X2 n=1 Tax=Sipha flava TaxID=143950 RepID=A0A8B8G3Y6_9HEMI|nr:uncharacterized protein LOC112688434 isoform X2 [Sipha flava]